jgi:hypothetical protein
MSFVLYYYLRYQSRLLQGEFWLRGPADPAIWTAQINAWRNDTEKAVLTRYARKGGIRRGRHSHGPHGETERTRRKTWTRGTFASLVPGPR